MVSPKTDVLLCFMQIAATLAAHPEGQRVMLRATAAPALIDLTVKVLQLPHMAAYTSALMLTCYLSFHPDMRNPCTANAYLLPLLLASAESLQGLQTTATNTNAVVSSSSSTVDACTKQQKQQSKGWVKHTGDKGYSAKPPAALVALNLQQISVPQGNVCAAVYAASALWALMYQGEKLKAAVRKLPNALQRLVAVHAHVTYALKNADVAKRLQVMPCSLAGEQDVTWWLQQLCDSIESVLELMQSAAVDVAQ